MKERRARFGGEESARGSHESEPKRRDRAEPGETTTPPTPAVGLGTQLLMIPNLLSLLRLAGVPLFLWLVLGPREDGWAIVVLGLSGVTDWLDGQIARRWNQVSEVGKMLDPVADRLYILAVLFGLAARDVIPIWLAVIIPLRDLIMLVGLFPLLRRHGYGPLPVHFLGKAGTFCLMYAFPLLFLGGGDSTFATAATVVGWAFAVWGTGLYWWAGVLYGYQAYQVLTARPEVEGTR